MMSNDVIHSLKRHFDLTFQMLELLIDQCQDELWAQKHGSFVFWQQLSISS